MFIFDIQPRYRKLELDKTCLFVAVRLNIIPLTFSGIDMLSKILLNVLATWIMDIAMVHDNPALPS